MDTSKFWSAIWIMQMNLKPSFPLSDHFWYLNPVLDCKILRESKDKCVYKSQQSTYLYRYDFMGLQRHKIDPFPNLIILESWNQQVPMQRTLSLLWAQNSFLKGLGFPCI